MTNFVRLFGGALGVLVAIVLASGFGVPPLDTGTIGGFLMLVGWIARLSANHPTASMQSTPLRLDNL